MTLHGDICGPNIWEIWKNFILFFSSRYYIKHAVVFRFHSLFNVFLKVTYILKSSGWGLKKSELPWEQNVLSRRRCVSCGTISLPSFNGLRCKLAKIALFIHFMLYWVEGMTSSVISFAYFTSFSNLNISGTNACICKL